MVLHGRPFGRAADPVGFDALVRAVMGDLHADHAPEEEGEKDGVGEDARDDGERGHAGTEDEAAGTRG